MSPHGSEPTQPPQDNTSEDQVSQEYIEEHYRRLSDVLSDYRKASTAPVDHDPSLKGRIMGIIHNESLRGPSTELVTPLENRYHVTTASLRAEVRRIIDHTTGLRARAVTLSPQDGQFRIAVSFTMAPHISIQQTVPTLRQRISEHLHEVFGIQTSTVDLTVEDIHHD